MFGAVTETIIGMLFSQFVLYSVGLFLAGIIKSHKKALRFGYLFVIFSYVLSIVIQYSGNTDFFRILSPLSYFEGLSVVNHGIEMLFVIISIIIVIGLVYVSFKKDRKERFDNLVVVYYMIEYESTILCTD